MAAQTFAEALTAIDRLKALPSLTYLSCSDPFWLFMFWDKIKKVATDSGSTIELAENLGTEAALVDALTQPNLFGENSYYVIDETPAGAAHRDLLTTLPFWQQKLCIRSTKAKRSKFPSGALEIEFAPPIDRESRSAVDWLLRCCGFSAEGRVVDLIQIEYGGNYLEFYNDIRFLKLGRPEVITLGLEDVRALAASGGKADVFQVSSELLDSRFQHAEIRTWEALANGDSSLSALGILAHHLRTCRKIKKDGESSVRLPKWIATRYNRHCALRTDRELVGAHVACAVSDLQLKSTRTAPQLVLSQVFIELRA
jgi:DNA polymerase III delta subunit